MKKIRTWLLRNASLKTLGFSLALMLIFNLIIWPKATSAINKEAGQEVGLLDVTFFAPADTIRHYLDYYGETGRSKYLLVESTFDTVYPLVYCLFFCIALTLLYRKIGPQGYIVGTVASFPVFAALFDYLENALIISHLVIYPVMPQLLTWLLVLFNTAKWLLTVATVLAVIAGLISFLLKKR
jgi:uncharacterized membrane protein